MKARLTALLLLAATSAGAADADTADPPLALVGGRVIVRAGETPLEGATVLVRNGAVEAVGVGLDLPFDARAVDVTGLTLTPGLADALAQRDLPFPARADEQGRPADFGRDLQPAMPEADRRGIAPERRAAAVLPQDGAEQPDAREAGVGSSVIVPRDLILSGTGALVLLDGRPPREAVAVADVALFGSLLWRSGPENYEGDAYPATLMGVMAQLRQVLLDAERESLLARRHAHDDPPRRAPQDAVLEALAPVVAGDRLLVLAARTEEDVRLALGLQDLLPHLRLAIAGGTEAFELADELARRRIGVIHDLDFGKEPEDPDAPPAKAGAPGKESEAGQAGEAGEPAEPGEAPSSEPKAGGDTPDGKTPGSGPWDPGVPARLKADRHARWLKNVAGVARLKQAGVAVAFGSFGRKPSELLEGARTAVDKGGLPAADALAAFTSGPAAVLGGGVTGGVIEPGAPALLTAWRGEPLAKDAAARLVVVDGVLFDLRNAKTAADDAKAKAASDEQAKADAETVKPGDQAAEAGGEAAKAGDDAATPAVDWPVELDTDREPSFRTGGNVLVRGATILTVSHGTLEGADLLVRDGRIAAVGPALAAPDGVRVVDAAGLYLMPGVIDCHCHAAIRGGINEWTRIVTPEVTIEDEVDPDEVDLYRALAGGVTTVRLLHGSSNAIGGRHEIIKLRWGRSAPELVFAGAPRGVKFALGENPRQSNGGGGRFPHTRMGVEAVIRRALAAGAAYRDTWAGFRADEAAGRDPDPPRRDLRLQALAGMLDGSIGIHSHCYQSDEILALIRIAEDFGIHVKTFQHVLEGYKIPREIAAHGAGGSTFVDWWGYKFEAYDATPYCAALMTEGGVTMSVNSDSDEHLRRLYLEAAKTVKYGGVPEQEALAMVTLNPARQLGIDGRVGSIDVGKDADFALFTRHPFDVRTRCRMTFVDGELTFERREDRWNAWAADVDRRIAQGRAQQTAALPPPERSVVEQRLRDVPRQSLDALDLPRDATRAASTPPRPPAPPVALVGGTVHTGETDHGAPVVYAPGVVLLEGGRIRGVYAGDGSPPAGFATEDVTGLHVWPGLIDADCSLGLAEIDSVAGTMDVNEIGRDQPDLRASAGWHADSTHIPVARANGITSALVVPAGERVAGQSSAMALEGWTAAEAVIRDAVALHVVAPRTSREKDEHAEAPDDGADDEGEAKEKKDEDKPLAERVDAAWKDLRGQFEAAREYARVSGEAARRGSAPPEVDARLAALAPYALGQSPVVLHADAADQIADALDFAKQQGLRPVIAGGQEAWKVADRLALEDVPVILGPVLSLPPTRDDLYDAPFTNASLLERAGVRFCFSTADSSNVRNLPYQAGMAVAYGLSEDAALRALTADAAEILGLSDEIGTLAPGRRADVLVTDGSPLQIRTTLKRIFIGGRDVGLATRHTELYERYRERLHDPSRPSH